MTIRADRRSLILARLKTILSGLAIELTDGTMIAAGNIVHNRDELPAEKVPGIILLDADEVKDPRFPPPTGRSTPVAPGLMKMTPEIYVVLDVRKPHNKNVGEDLNLARAAILHLLMHDVDLATYVGASGSITFDGCYTDLARNRQMKGQMGLSITFGYPFIPGEFATA